MIELNARRLGVDPTLEKDYEALHDGAAIVSLSSRGRLRFHGPGAKDALNGLLTCDVALLAPGQGCYGAALTSKGKVIADVTVFAMENSFLVECPAPAWDAWRQLVTKFVNPRISKRTDETEATSEIGVFGSTASALLASVGYGDKEALAALSPYSHLEIVDKRANVARIPDLGVEGFRLIVARDDEPGVTQSLESAGGRVVGAEAVAVARIEAGYPAWGVDMDDNTLPQEANLEALNAISYTKGCYTGQEVVARLHFRGHVNKRLVGLRIDGAAMPASGTTVTADDGRECGDVRSVAMSPRYGVIGLAMIRREIGVGDGVSLLIDDTPTRALVAALPFER
jgi:folate-binding protein YgfZ